MKSEAKQARQRCLAGFSVEVVQAANPSLIGIKGKVVDETKETLRIATEKEEKTVLKHQVTIKVRETGEVLDGQAIRKRAEDRIKG